MDSRSKNLFAIGLTRRNHAKLKALPDAEQMRFLQLLPYQRVKRGHEFLIEEPLAEARERLDRFERQDGPVDGLINYWDFPVSVLTAILAHERGLPAPRLESLLKCHHKYWARRIQQRVIPEAVPQFQVIDPFAEAPWDQVFIATPFWMKPITAFLGQLGFRVDDAEDFFEALPVIRARIGEFGGAMAEVVRRLEVPEDVAEVTGHHMIAEGLIGGRQCTVEGFAYEGEIHCYGIVDSYVYPHAPVFQRLEYPSRLPEEIQRRIIFESEKIMTEVGLERGPFNIEYYWDEESDHLWLLEINPRISQSHGDNFEKVDGVSNHKVIVDLALGRRPHMPHREGKYACAAKFMLRHFRDAVVRHVPTEDEIAGIQRRFPDTVIDITVREGNRLSWLQHQDMYSYLLAEVFLGAASHDELMEKYGRIEEALPFDLEDRGSIDEARQRMAEPGARDRAYDHLHV